MIFVYTNVFMYAVGRAHPLRDEAPDLIASDVLVFETDANPDAVRRDFAAQAIAKATQFVKTDDHLKARARTFIDAGISAFEKSDRVRPAAGLSRVVRFAR